MARTSFLHGSLSMAFLSSSFHVWPISFMADSTVLLQVVFGRPGFLLPSGVHLRDTLVMLFVGFLSTCPIHRQRYFLRIAHMFVELVISCRFFFIDFNRSEYLEYSSQATVMEARELVNVPFSHPPTFRTIQQNW